MPAKHHTSRSNREARSSLIRRMEDAGVSDPDDDLYAILAFHGMTPIAPRRR